MFSLLIAGLLAAAPAPSQTLVVRSTHLWISGTSNLHDWTCEAPAVHPRIQVEAQGSGPGLLPSAVDLTVPVAAIRCGNDTMDGKLRDALKAAAHPSIEFALTSAQAVSSQGDKVLARGRLTIAGVTRRIGFVAHLTRHGEEVQVQGDVPVEMPDYQVTPPTALFGTLKTGKQVVVHFALSFASPPVRTPAALGSNP